MKLETWMEREAGKGKKEILAAHVNYEKVKDARDTMREAGYKPDGAIRRSEVTGDWFQWWHRVETVQPSTVQPNKGQWDKEPL